LRLIIFRWSTVRRASGRTRRMRWASRMVVEGDLEMALEIAEQARRVAAVVLDAATSRLTVCVAGGSH
jgi:hypothetical protein